MKIIRLKNQLTVILSDGSSMYTGKCTDDMHDQILQAEEERDEDMVKRLISPELENKKEEIQLKTEILENYSNSSILSAEGNSIYMRSVSDLTLPPDLAENIYRAEKEGNKILLETYTNFWTLCSLNPDAEARKNMFWFLDKYGFVISRSGLFTAYRNVDLKSEGLQLDAKLAALVTKFYTRYKYVAGGNPSLYWLGFRRINDDVYSTKMETYTEEEKEEFQEFGNLQTLYDSLSSDGAPVFTDKYTHKMVIKVGTPVTMPREECDAVQTNTCSRGLHVAGKDWLDQWYFGGVTLRVLVNPADVVAVPPQDGYGKMRCCAYYPIEIIEWSEDDKMVDNDIPHGFEDDFIDKICYEGEVNNEDASHYAMQIPAMPELNKRLITNRLQSIKKSLKMKYVN